MPTYTLNDVESNLESYGEILVVLDSDAYNNPIELHLHDTTFYYDLGVVVLDLADGEIEFGVDSIESMTIHQQSTEDLGL